MLKILNNVITYFINTLKFDKMLHFFFGFIISYISSFFLSISYVFIVTLLIAIFKEVKDSFDLGNKFDIIDIIFTILPITLIYLKFL